MSVHIQKILHRCRRWSTRESCPAAAFVSRLRSFRVTAAWPAAHPTGLAQPSQERRRHKISQQHIFMVLRISGGKAKGFGKKVSPSPTALCLFPSSTSPPLLYTDAASADCLQHPQSKCFATPTQVFPQLSAAWMAVYLMKGKHIDAFFPRSFLLPGSIPV